MIAVPLTFELVRFEVPPERQGELVDGHDAAQRAIHAVAPPGAFWSRLARIGERGWLEIVAWPERATFERAHELAPSDPTAAAWFALAEPGWSSLIGEIADPPPTAPPRQGELVLDWGAAEPGGGPDGSGEDGWSTLIEIEPRAWVDPSGWTEREPSALRLAAASDVAGSGIAASKQGAEREVAQIVCATDAAGKPDADA